MNLLPKHRLSWWLVGGAAAGLILGLFAVYNHVGGNENQVSPVHSSLPGHGITNVPSPTSKVAKREDPRAGNELRSLTYSRDPDATRDAMAQRYRSIVNSELRAQEKYVEIERIAKAYIAEVGIDYALEHLDSIAGPGQLQNQLLWFLFEHSPGDDQAGLVGKARSLAGDAALAALEGVFRNMKANGINHAALDVLFPLKEGESRLFDYFVRDLAVYNNATGFTILAEIPALIAAAYPDPVKYEEHLKGFLLRVAESKPGDAMALCRKLGEYPELQKEVAGRCLMELIRRTPDEGMKEAVAFMKENRGILEDGTIANFMGQYLRADYNAAVSWMNSNRESMEPWAKDSVTNGLVQFNLSQKNIDEAKVWLEQIADPELRKNAEGRVWGQERDNLRAEVRKDPQAIVDGIVSGEANYGDYWLEEAMQTWMSKDFDQAHLWYEDNWSNLPREKAQYVAAAFAVQALNHGDTDTATQWQALISDRKTKERIAASIARAEDANKQ